MLVSLILLLWVISIVGASPTLRTPVLRLVGAGTKVPAQITASTPNKLSDPAKSLYREYMKLPEDSRPFPDIMSVLRGLDASTSHDVRARIDHFNQNRYMRNHFGNHWEYKFSWEGDSHFPCSHDSCDFREYYILRREIQQLQKQLAAKERALNLQNNSANLDQARELAEALRRERAIQRQVTEELS